jgi:hypothetical protein
MSFILSEAAPQDRRVLLAALNSKTLYHEASEFFTRDAVLGFPSFKMRKARASPQNETSPAHTGAHLDELIYGQRELKFASPATNPC